MGNLTTLKKLNAFLESGTSGHGIAKPKDMEKKSLQKQVLDWSGRDFNEKDKVKAERELKDLKRHSNLEDLAIHHFIGSNFPSWKTDGLLQNLVTLSLYHCTKCKILSLGQLPCLRGLYINGMQELEEWPEDQYTSLCTLHIINCLKLRKVPSFMSHLRFLKVKRCDSLKALPMAPSLLFLILINNLVLEDWQEGKCIAQCDQGNLVGLPSPAFFGPLELKLLNCPKIQALPRLCALQKREISGCELVSVFPVPQVAQRLLHLALDTCSSVTLVRAIPNTLHSLAFYISGCKSLTFLSEAKESLQSLSSLQLLSIQGCPMLESLPDEGLPTVLECLMIGSCPLLKSLGAKETLKSLLLLKDLYLEIDSIKLSSTQMRQRTKEGFVDLFAVKVSTIFLSNIFPCSCMLSKLSMQNRFIYEEKNDGQIVSTHYPRVNISDCKGLTSLSVEIGSSKSLSSLKMLSIRGCSKLESLTDEGLPTAIDGLVIASCPILKSPDAKETLKSLLLKDLYLDDCPSPFLEDGLPTSLGQRSCMLETRAVKLMAIQGIAFEIQGYNNQPYLSRGNRRIDSISNQGHDQQLPFC
ncbi:uncharacterized protein LOC111277473 [Durio zibethinus]|uniref:Uncharacterized protein LOC111277473 n=1 Tax=Durio zibethinus TaxID=66656 RepID=A0A6P5WVG4_DURZI|nr:uncharacterized protein LOC111277473 [Durio zibethinus]